MNEQRRLAESKSRRPRRTGRIILIRDNELVSSRNLHSRPPRLALATRAG